MESVTIYTDGGSRLAKGLGAAAAILIRDNEPTVPGTTERLVHHFGTKFLPLATNNQAEYWGVIIGLEEAIKHGYKKATVLADSQLVINQVNGVYAVKNEKLFPLWQKVINLAAEFDLITFTHIPREENADADKLCNIEMDNEVEKRKHEGI